MREEEGDVEEGVGVVEVGLGRETSVWVCVYGNQKGVSHSKFLQIKSPKSIHTFLLLEVCVCVWRLCGLIIEYGAGGDNKVKISFTVTVA